MCLTCRVSAEYRKVVQNKQTLAEKKNENDAVMEEFKKLDDGAKVYKLVGPILAKQELSECKDNVEKRIAFMDKEIARLATMETAFQAKVDEKTASVKKTQTDMQRFVMELQAKAAQQQQPQQ